jgi:hypothetical protein
MGVRVGICWGSNMAVASTLDNNFELFMIGRTTPDVQGYAALA